MPSFKALVHKWEIPAAEGDGSVKRQLATQDLLPVPAEKRQWTKWSYSAFWLADSFNVKRVQVIERLGSNALTLAIQHFCNCVKRSRSVSEQLTRHPVDTCMLI